MKLVLLGLFGGIAAILLSAVFAALSGFLFLKEWEYLQPLTWDDSPVPPLERFAMGVAVMAFAFVIALILTFAVMTWLARDKSPP
jgi:TRAP-type C4-dicarboxylate transport system permease small subunit